ncbi:MAG TPA: kelch repeat-containing protein [Thermoplasmata archaeon]|nr:kelch repeat-containing protein [Thermoplasmata archaeon]
MMGAAYYPPTNSTILFGGNYGNSNTAYGDTWQFQNNSWTQLFPPVSPSPRWGGTMVYDPAIDSLVLFGGRNITTFYNDTWTFNTTGWHNVTSTVAPSPRAFYGMSYDAAADEIVLLGGAVGNYGGNGSPFTYYNDTWTYQGGVWTNITSSAGVAPLGAVISGQMTYDPTDGYVVLTGGVLRDFPCGFVFGSTYIFANGSWSQLRIDGASPPPGEGVMWYDSQLDRVLYYEGAEDLSGVNCEATENELWSYSGGVWTYIPQVGTSAPAPRTEPMFVDDVADNEQVMFGGHGPFVYKYQQDTWILSVGVHPVYTVTYSESGLPTHKSWTVSFFGVVHSAPAGTSIQFSVLNGTYPYLVQSDGGYQVSGLPASGTLDVHGSDVNVSVLFVHGPTFTLTFHERGLGPFSNWCVTVGATVCSTTPRVQFKHLTPGTYDYSLQPVGNLSTLTKLDGGIVASNGTVTVSHGTTFQILFGSSVHFVETGLPNGTNWTVHIGGHATRSNSSTIVVLLRNGSYSFHIPNVPGFVSSMRVGALYVGGHAIWVSVQFTPRS